MGRTDYIQQKNLPPRLLLQRNRSRPRVRSSGSKIPRRIRTPELSRYLAPSCPARGIPFVSPLHCKGFSLPPNLLRVFVIVFIDGFHAFIFSPGFHPRFCLSGAEKSIIKVFALQALRSNLLTFTNNTNIATGWRRRKVKNQSAKVKNCGGLLGCDLVSRYNCTITSYKPVGALYRNSAQIEIYLSHDKKSSYPLTKISPIIR